MRKQTALFRRARCLSVYWGDGHLCFHNFATRLTTSGKPITCEVLSFFDNWRTPQQAVTRFREYSKKSVRSAVSELVNRELLLQKDSPEAEHDHRIARAWSDWLPQGSFHFSTKDTPYVDRSNWSLQRVKPFLPKGPQPNVVKTVKGAKEVVLPRRAFRNSEFIRVLQERKTHRRFSNDKLPLELVSQLLSLVWGVTGYRNCPRFGKSVLKTSPSGGARHPGEVYLMALSVQGLTAGVYHYQPATHRLEMISTNASHQKAWLYCARQHFVRNAAALFIMTAVFPRTMWKYHHPRAYRVVLLDAGHLCQTFCLVATWLGLAPFCTAALKDTLIEKELGIDGVSESVLYVAGVGLPATSVRARRQSSRNADRHAANPSQGGA